MVIRATKKEIVKTLRKMEEKYGLKKGVLSEVYHEEADVVFMGRRRDILKQVRKIVKGSILPKGEKE